MNAGSRNEDRRIEGETAGRPHGCRALSAGEEGIVGRVEPGWAASDYDAAVVLAGDALRRYVNGDDDPLLEAEALVLAVVQGLAYGDRQWDHGRFQRLLDAWSARLKAEAPHDVSCGI